MIKTSKNTVITKVKPTTNENKFMSFLEKFRLNSNCKNEINKPEISHTIMVKPYGKFYVPPDKMMEFYKLYDTEIKKGNAQYIIEQHCEYGPILIDIDLKYDQTIEKRIYTDKHVELIVQIYIF